jgi:hypothetical protein
MAISAHWFDKGILGQFGATPVNWTSDTIKVSLHTSSYAYSQTGNQFFSDTTNEITGTGYSAGGATLTSPTAVLTSGVIVLSGANTVWTTATLTARIAAIYKSTGTAGTSPLLGFVDFGADVSSTAASFTIVWSGSGIFTLTPA